MKHLINWIPGIWALCCCFAPSVLLSQTEGTLTFSVTTTSTGSYSPRNVVSLWIENASGDFVKTKMRYGINREHDLVYWLQKSGGNVIDAVTGATRTTHGTRTITWDGTDVNGTLVPDGEYKVWMELAWYNTPPAGPTNSVSFVKGPNSVTLNPPNTTNFLNQVLEWVPQNPSSIAQNDASSSFPIARNVFPNPFQDKVNVLFQKKFEGMVRFSLLDAQGNTIRVFSRYIEPCSFIELSYGTLPQGVYFLRLQSSDLIQSIRLIKIK